MILAIVLLVLVFGTVVFHFVSPWYFTPIASNWEAMDDTVTLTFVVTGIGFVLVNGFIAYCVIRFRKREGVRAHYEPENTKLEVWLTVFTTVAVAAMLAPGLFIWAQVVTPPDEATEVEVFAQQWNWSFRLPGSDGKLGVVEASFVEEGNPLGINPEDPYGRDDIVVRNPVLHLPMNKPVTFLLRSIDVLHNFTVPQFRVKMDFVPGIVTYIWATPTRTGSFDLLCEELCGIGHYAMRGSVVVDEQADYDTWLASQPTFEHTQASLKGDAALGAANYAVCAACHGAQGEGNAQMHAPKLAGHDASYIKRQLKNFKQGLRGTHENDVWGKNMAAMAMTLPDEAAVNNVVAYISGLPDSPSLATVQGDPARAKQLFDSTCAACHGADGGGRWSVNAPSLKGMNDWYLAQQLNNFKHGIRGRHPQDLYGLQMGLVSRTLADETAINNMVAYINKL